ncbi:putative multidrug resistance ABC transporter ATP-binding/permease protein YheH [Paenibacillus solanacearum]|uniref:Multidrug resistance ABC transporter ATP-binding/permease protein YheH n=1 Tax=Paenibacillus solanacearum TaxID=2048548 RepID=A0A916JZ55_9BACL|nr:ABC transporter ATP-binding protein [Paenibacillus solanacearum]CAG7617309.1 putative multidrug resistance ABC transporter ATP-binding/permease protein YheH [Paenibacillus solanacearum]
MKKTNRTGARLFQYAWGFKRPILIALALLTLAVCAEMAGPLIAKRMIDRHILGIEFAWYEASPGDTAAVPYDGKRYKRSDHWAEGEAKGPEAHVLQVGRSYYFVAEPLAFDGRRSVEGERLTVRSQDGREAAYTAKQLTAAELFGFYRPELSVLLVLAVCYFGLLVLSALFTYGQRYLLQTSANRIIARMRTDVFAHVQRLPVPYFDNLPAGKVVSRITNDTESVRELYVNVLANFFSGIIYMGAILGALFLLNPTLAVIALPMLPLTYVWILVYRRFAAAYNRVIRARLSDINGIINESIQGMPIIRAFRRQKHTMNEFERLNGEYFAYQNKMLNLNSITSHNLVNVFRNIIFLIVIWMFGGQYLGPLVTVGVLYAFVDYMNRMFQPIVGIVNQLSNLETALVSAERVFELLDEEGTDVVSGKLERYRGDVSFEGVHFAYKNDEMVLQDISFEAKQGETVALIGHTGSGKSSILNLLFRFYDPQRGTIRIDGRDISGIPRQLLRQHMGIVLQDPFLFTGTIASNISLNDPAVTRDRVEQALRDVGAYDMFMSLPGGIDEPVIEKGSTLSAGQRQLISFARALAFDPAILILDEATASIDTETEAVIQNALDVLKQGRTTFVIAHRLSTIRSADQILVLDHGRIVERGNHEELMRLQGKYDQMYRLQAGEALADGTNDAVLRPAPAR